MFIFKLMYSARKGISKTFIVPLSNLIQTIQIVLV